MNGEGESEKKMIWRGRRETAKRSNKFSFQSYKLGLTDVYRKVLPKHSGNDPCNLLSSKFLFKNEFRTNEKYTFQ